jgi:hypothetical protein
MFVSRVHKQTKPALLTSRLFIVCITDCTHAFRSQWPHGPQYFPRSSCGLCRSGVATRASQALWHGDRTFTLLYPTLEWKVKGGLVTTACHRSWQHVQQTLSTNGHMTTSTITCWVCQLFFFTRTPLLREYLTALPNPLPCCLQVRLGDPRITCMLAWRPHRYSTLFYNVTNGYEQFKYDDPIRHYVARLVDLLDEWALHNFYHHFMGASLVGLLRDTVSQ